MPRELPLLGLSASPISLAVALLTMIESRNIPHRSRQPQCCPLCGERRKGNAACRTLGKELPVLYRRLSGCRLMGGECPSRESPTEGRPSRIHAPLPAGSRDADVCSGSRQQHRGRLRWAPCGTEERGRKQSICFGSLERRSGHSFDLAQRSRLDPSLPFGRSAVNRRGVLVPIGAASH